jgi:hypothetical protein
VGFMVDKAALRQVFSEYRSNGGLDSAPAKGS